MSESLHRKLYVAAQAVLAEQISARISAERTVGWLPEEQSRLYGEFAASGYHALRFNARAESARARLLLVDRLCEPGPFGGPPTVLQALTICDNAIAELCRLRGHHDHR